MSQSVSPTSDWAGHLDPSGRILSQGSPSGRFRLVFRSPLEALLALFFFGFSILLLLGAAQTGGLLWMIGLILFSIGFFELVGVHLSDASQRRRTFYILTSRRALIATELFGRRRLASYPITAETAIDLVDSTLGSVFFARGTMMRKTWRGRKVEPTGFELIESARAVFALMRKVQTEGAE